MKMKKTYINPETVVVEVELQQMMVGSPVDPNLHKVGAEEDGMGKDFEISSGSIWGEEE